MGNRFVDLSQRVNLKYEILKIIKKMVKTDQDIFGEHGIRNDDDVLGINGENEKIAWEHYHKNF